MNLFDKYMNENFNEEFGKKHGLLPSPTSSTSTASISIPSSNYDHSRMLSILIPLLLVCILILVWVIVKIVMWHKKTGQHSFSLSNYC